MKQWEKPEMKVFDIKMNENIAASGDVDRTKEKRMLIIKDTDPNTVDTHKYVAYYTDTNMVIETSYSFGSGTLQLGADQITTQVSDEMDIAGCHGGNNQ